MQKHEAIDYNKSEDTVHAVLSITESNNHFTYLLEGTSPKPIESRHSDDLTGRPIGLIRRWLTGKLEENDVRKFDLTKFNDIVSQQYKIMLGSIGSIIYDLLPDKIAYALQDNDVEYLSLKIDDSLADIPWELMNDGRDFFCMKYSIGREIDVKKQGDCTSKKEIRFLLIEDPTYSLQASQNEINYILAGLTRLPNVKVRRYGMEMRKKDFLNALRDGNFDILHFSGHGFFDPVKPDNSHLLFYDYKNPCYAHEIAESLGNKAHALVFSNACTSAQTILGQQGLVRAFLANGTAAYVGSIFPVNDQLAGMIGEEFYRYIIHGKTIGEALRLARLNSYKKFGWTSLSWGYYILYGNPALRIFRPEGA